MRPGPGQQGAPWAWGLPQSGVWEGLRNNGEFEVSRQVRVPQDRPARLQGRGRRRDGGTYAGLTSSGHRDAAARGPLLAPTRHPQRPNHTNFSSVTGCIFTEDNFSLKCPQHKVGDHRPPLKGA